MPLNTARLADLRQPDEGVRAGEIEPAVKPGKRDRLVLAGCESTVPRRRPRDSSSHSRPACQRGECGIDRPRDDDPSRRDLHQHAAGRLVGPPAAAASVAPSAVT